MTIYELQKRAKTLREKTQTASITPEEVGGLHEDTLGYIASLEQSIKGLGVRKVYKTKDAMETDTTPIGTNGKALHYGQLVCIYDDAHPDNPENGNIYAFQAPGWLLMSNIGKGVVPPVVQEAGDSTIKVMSQVAVTELLTEYDVSLKTKEKYTLQQAINAVPAVFQKGGLTIKFINQSGNYVAYSNTHKDWSTTESDWIQSGDSKSVTIPLMDIKPGDNNLIHFANGEVYKGDNWSCGNKILISPNFHITGKVYLYPNMPAVLCFNETDTIIKYIAVNTESKEKWVVVDTKSGDQKIPEDTKYIKIQSSSVEIGEVNLNISKENLFHYLNKGYDLEEQVLAKRIDFKIDPITFAYQHDGRIWKDGTWSMIGAPIKLKKGMAVSGFVRCFNNVVPPIVFFDKDGAFAGCINDIGVTDDHLASITFTRESESVPKNAASFAIQSHERGHLKNSLTITVPLISVLNEQLETQIDDYSPGSKVLAPRTIYTLANDADKNNYTGFSSRTYSANLYVGNFLQGLKKEPKRVQFGNGKRVLTIPFLSKDYANLEAAKLLDGTKNKMEEELSYAIVGNTSKKQEFKLKHRSCLNSASKDKVLSVFFIGDSITYGQNAFFADRKQRASYPMLVNEMGYLDSAANGGRNYLLKTMGRFYWVHNVRSENANIPIKTFHEGRQGDSLQGFMRDSMFLDASGNFSLKAYIEQYRTCDDNGNRLYFDTAKRTKGAPRANNIGYLEDGTDSGFKIGSKIKDTETGDVFKPTHVFEFMGTNRTYSREELDAFIRGIRTAGNDIIIGVGCPHFGGTYFPSDYPNFINCEHWVLGESQQQIEQQTLLNSLDASAYEAQKVYFIDTYWTNPGAYSAPIAEVSELASAYDEAEHFKKYIAIGQAAYQHVSAYAHCGYAQQIYAWIKWSAIT